jgi:hypothetical protein
MADILKSPNSLMETSETGIIVAGGPSSSELLNDLRDGIISDVSELDRRTSELEEKISDLSTILDRQAAALSTAISSLGAQLPATDDKWLADFFVEDLIFTGSGGNTAEISTLYGQATLPILTQQDKLVGQDTQGNIWIPRTSQLHYANKSTAPVESEWLSDEDAVHALDQRSDTAWWRDRGTSGDVYIRAVLPTSLNANRLSNCIILHPFPVLSYDLVSVEYRKPDGTWTSADLSYLEGWNGSKVVTYGNVRIWIPQSQVTEIRAKLTTPGIWGFADIRVQQVEFSPTATLAVDFSSYSPGTLTTSRLYGKDQSSLAYLTSSINDTKVLVDLVQTTQNSSPVVTAIEGAV